MKLKDLDSTIEELKKVGAEVSIEKEDSNTTYSYRKKVYLNGGSCYLGLAWGFIVVRHKSEYGRRTSVSVRHHNWFAKDSETVSQIEWEGFFSGASLTL